MAAARRGLLSSEAAQRCPLYRVLMTSTVENPPPPPHSTPRSPRLITDAVGFRLCCAKEKEKHSVCLRLSGIDSDSLL